MWQGKQQGCIPASQFELCIRSAGINAPRAVFNVLLEVVGLDEEGQVDYVKFLEDLEIEENMGVEEMKLRRQTIQVFPRFCAPRRCHGFFVHSCSCCVQHQMAAEEQEKAYLQQQQREYEQAQPKQHRGGPTMSATKRAARDTRMLIEVRGARQGFGSTVGVVDSDLRVRSDPCCHMKGSDPNAWTCRSQVDSLPDGRHPGMRTQSYFKPKHLTSAFTNDVGTVFSVPGGPLGVELVDSQEQPPIEQAVLDGELHFMRDFVHKDKVEMQKAIRQCLPGETPMEMPR